MKLTIKSLHKSLLIIIAASVCCKQTCAINLVKEKTLYYDNKSSLCFDDILIKNKKLLCYGGIENLSSFPEELLDNVDVIFPFSEAKNYFLNQDEITSKKHVFFTASNPNNEIIGTVTRNSNGKNFIDLCNTSFMPIKEIKMRKLYLKPTKIYYTPDGKYLVALTYYSWYDNRGEENHKKFFIEIIDPNKKQIISSYEIDHRIPKHSEFRDMGDIGPDKDIDYLLIPDNQHIVYISDCFDSEYYSGKHYGEYYFEILRLNQQTLCIKKIKDFKKEEALYQVLADELKKNKFVRPLYIDIKNGYFLLHFESENCIKKYSSTEQKYSASIDDINLFNSHFLRGNQVALFPNTYFAIYDYKKNMVQLFDFDLKKLAETEMPYCESLQFSDDGKKLIATKNKKITIITVEFIRQ